VSRRGLGSGHALRRSARLSPRGRLLLRSDTLLRQISKSFRNAGGVWLTSNPNTSSPTRDRHKPQHVPRIPHLERQRRHQTPHHNKSRCQQHATLATKSVGHIAEDQYSNDRADEERVGNTRLAIRGVDLFSQNVAEDDICRGCQALLVAVGEVGESAAEDSDDGAGLAVLVARFFFAIAIFVGVWFSAYGGLDCFGLHRFSGLDLVVLCADQTSENCQPTKEVILSSVLDV
jgi:hypothetical protein